MDLDDLIRYTWTFGAAVAMPYALWNLREVLADGYAMSQDRRQLVTDAAREQSLSDVWLHGLLTFVILCNLCAGIFAVMGVPVGALSFLCVGLFTKVFLVFNHAQRRRKIFTLRSAPDPQLPAINSVTIIGAVVAGPEDVEAAR